MNTSKFFELAELAEASYANLWDADKSQVIIGKDDVIKALGKTGFSESQATEFTTNWEVVSGGHLPNTGTGYSGTLFRRLTDDPVSGFNKGQYE
ncbi:hypothetical protein [Halothiobacillus diazotrophicus]|uniref:hypothetical protein n=1 Tax=Halothiobacillus diazotrophicus TaxID=1860122 RepID=UPI0012E9134F|nr:hypothetical protein [Halothiobacillus diazotrophicus]